MHFPNFWAHSRERHMRKANPKRRKSTDWLKPLKVVLDLEPLESCVPVSEQISTLVALHTLASVGVAPLPIPGSPTTANRLALPHADLTGHIVLIPASSDLTPVSTSTTAPRPLDAAVLTPNLAGGLDLDPLTLPDFSAAPHDHRAGFWGSSSLLPMIDAPGAGAGAAGGLPSLRASDAAAATSGLGQGLASPETPIGGFPADSAATTPPATPDTGSSGTQDPAAGARPGFRSGDLRGYPERFHAAC